MAKLMVVIILCCAIIGINSQLPGSLGLFGPPTGLPAWGPPLDLHGSIVKAQITKLGPLTPELQVRVDEILENYNKGAEDCQTSLGASAPHWFYRICVIGHMKIALNEIKIIENELAASTTVAPATANAGPVA